MLSISCNTLQTTHDFITGDDATVCIAVIIPGRESWVFDVEFESSGEISASCGCRAGTSLDAGVVGVAKHAIAGRIPQVVYNM